MTFHLVHTGKGVVRKVDLPDAIDLTLDVPRKPQTFSGLAKFLSRRTFQEQRRASDTAHTNYKPGKLAQLGRDQCREVIVDETYVMCGAKVHKRGFCKTHYNKNWKARQ